MTSACDCRHKVQRKQAAQSKTQATLLKRYTNVKAFLREAGDSTRAEKFYKFISTRHLRNRIASIRAQKCCRSMLSSGWIVLPWHRLNSAAPSGLPWSAQYFPGQTAL